MLNQVKLPAVSEYNPKKTVEDVLDIVDGKHDGIDRTAVRMIGGIEKKHARSK